MADLSGLKGLDPETFAACMRIAELLTFLNMHPEHIFQPGQYPYVEHAEPPRLSTREVAAICRVGTAHHEGERPSPQPSPTRGEGVKESA